MINKVYNNIGDELQPDVVFHPEIVLNEEIEERGFTKKDFAFQLSILPQHLSEIFPGKRNISAVTAVKLESILDISAEYWLVMQTDYDLYVARHLQSA